MKRLAAALSLLLLLGGCGGDEPFAEVPDTSPLPRAAATASATATGTPPPTPTEPVPPTPTVSAAAAEAAREAVRAAYVSYREGYAGALLARDIRLVEPYVTEEERALIVEELRVLGERNLAARVQVWEENEEITLLSEGEAEVRSLLRDATVAIVPPPRSPGGGVRSGEQRPSLTRLVREAGRWLVAGSVPRVEAPSLSLETLAAEVGVTFAETVRPEITPLWGSHQHDRHGRSSVWGEPVGAAGWCSWTGRSSG